MHLHIITASPVFTAPLIQRVKDQLADDYIILITESFRLIKCIMKTGERVMDIFKVVGFLKTNAIYTCTTHFLSTQAAYIIRSLPKTVCVKWVVWGGDFYGLPQVRNSYLIYQMRHDNIKTRIGYRLINSILSRINVIATNPCDQLEIETKLGLDVDYLSLNHLLSIQDFEELKPVQEHQTLLLGNSDDQYNNHIATIEKLSNLTSRETKVVVPLSGVDNTYTQMVKERVMTVFKNAEILDRFIDKEEYQSILSRCFSLVFGHLRQQGMATLFSFLLSGRKCYFFSQNPYYKYLKAEGFHVFALEEIKASHFWEPITEKQAGQNKEKLKTMLASELINHQWNTIFEYSK